jgi:hypothetical protein
LRALAGKLQDFKIVLVNDRIDLETQLSETARLIGAKVNIIQGTSGLRDHLSTGASDVNMVMIHKFMERADPRRPGETNSRREGPGHAGRGVDPEHRVPEGCRRDFRRAGERARAVRPASYRPGCHGSISRPLTGRANSKALV